MATLRIVPPQGPPIVLTGRPMHLGREASCEIVVRDTAASRRHARVESDGAGGFVLTDLNSANGTFVNGVRRERVRIDADDWIQIGRERFHVEVEEEPERGTELVTVDAIAHRAGRTIGPGVEPPDAPPPAPPVPAAPTVPMPPTRAAAPPPPPPAPASPAAPPRAVAVPPPPRRADPPAPPPVPPPPPRPVAAGGRAPAPPSPPAPGGRPGPPPVAPGRRPPPPPVAPPAADAGLYFVLLGGKLTKLTAGEVRARLRSGELDDESKAWKGGLDGWKPISTFRELGYDDDDDEPAAAPPAAPPPPPPLPRRR